MSGEEVLSIVSSKYPEVPVIITTAIDEVETVVRCMKAGAFDYVVKPVHPARLLTTVRRALEFRDLRRENIFLKESVFDTTLKHPEAFSEIITQNPTMRSIFRYIESIAVTSQSVLITGETGVGKELVARAIHRLSGRKGDLVAVNVAGLDDTTFSDTLFGHKRGAFTTAIEDKPGLIEIADKGTLFLDEIGDMSLEVQAQLLKVIEEKRFMRLGETHTRHSDFRLICASNQNLADEAKKGGFRNDLLFRINIFPIPVPPL